MYVTSNDPGLYSTQPMSCLKCTPACILEDSLQQRGHISVFLPQIEEEMDQHYDKDF
jgi:hypothetical protein